MSDPTAIHPFPVDPGGIFASDFHRRILAFLPHDDGDEATLDSIELPDLISRLHDDLDSIRTSGPPREIKFVPWTEADLDAILQELEGSGFAYAQDGRWTASEAGIEALTGPALDRREKQPDGSLKLVESPPMEGKRLEQAEAINDAAAEEQEAFERRAATARLERAEEELAAAKARVAEVAP